MPNLYYVLFIKTREELSTYINIYLIFVFAKKSIYLVTHVR